MRCSIQNEIGQWHYLSIYGIYIAPLQGNYSEALPGQHGRRPGAEFGGTKKIFRGLISGKISISRVKISYDLFLVIDLVLRIFPFFSHIFRMFTVLNVVYDHFLTRKPPFFTLFILSRTSDNTTSQNIGWTNPPPQIFLGGASPQSP